MKKASMKKVFYLFAALGGIFFITITGCQKDKSKPENAPADVIKLATSFAVIGVRGPVFLS